MIWVDREAKKIRERKLPLEWVDDMKTPSGRIHVGSLRGVVIHDLIYKVLIENNLKTRFTYVFDDNDPMDDLPAYLEKAKWEKFLGVPLYKVPSPEKGYKSYGEYWAKEFIAVFNSINCHPKIIWSSELYNSGKMNSVIKEILDATPKIREIYRRVSKTTPSDDWYPFNVVCEKCGKIGTTSVYKWDGQNVYYRCQPDKVAWAVGCSHQGKVSPFNGVGKLPWKVEWAAKWKVIGVTVEGAGKDHMSAGGSHDIAKAICSEILHYPVPYPFAYEWFTIGGRKMSSSKGIGTSAKEASQILPPEVFRFLLVRTHVETHLDFNPFGDTIPNLFDDYDRCMNAYFLKIENKLPKEKQGEVMEDFARIIELSEVRPHPKKRILLPRFRTIVNLLKNNTDISAFFEKQKGAILTKEEREILEERITYAKLYLKNYAKEITTDTEGQDKTKFVLSENQKRFLVLLKAGLEKLDSPTSVEIQNTIFSILKEHHFKPKEAFQAFYQALTGKKFGPKAHDLILKIGVKNVKVVLNR